MGSGTFKRVSGIVLAGAAFAAPLATQAGEGFYAGVHGGFNFLEDQTFKLYGYTAPLGIGLAPPPDGSVITKTIFDEGPVGGLTAGYSFGFLRPEIEFSYRSNDVKTQLEQDFSNILLPPPRTEADNKGKSSQALSGMLNLWIDIMKDSHLVHPYIGGGYGLTKFKVRSPTYQGDDLESDDDQVGTYQIGAGVGIDLTDNLELSFDYRYVRSKTAEFDFDPEAAGNTETKYKASSAMVGLRYYFSSKEEPAPVPEVLEPVAVVPVAAICGDATDNDGDGLVDFPADPGCSAADDADETDPAACSDGKDNDGDGLSDFPGDKGCSAADDTDETDPCRAPEPGEAVSLKGCGTGDVIVLRGVNFEFNKSNLTANAKTIMDGVASELAAYPGIKIELSGHTDSKGSDEYNQKLSEKRANSVRQYLIGKNVASERITAVGMGEGQPVADNETDEGRELNRRVELKVIEGNAAASVAAAPAAPAADAPVAEGSTP